MFCMLARARYSLASWSDRRLPFALTLHASCVLSVLQLLAVACVFFVRWYTARQEQSGGQPQLLGFMSSQKQAATLRARESKFGEGTGKVLSKLPFVGRKAPLKAPPGLPPAGAEASASALGLDTKVSTMHAVI